MIPDMLNFNLALRNIGRNRRRSAATIIAIALSCAGLALFGGYVSWTFRAVEEQTVGAYGHIQIYKKGYYERGAGNPAAFAIPDYESLKKKIESDPVLAPMLELVTGQILFNGMVTSPSTQASSTFAGLGVFPSEDKRITKWNPYKITDASSLPINAPIFSGIPELDDADITGGSVGLGLARVLQLNAPAKSESAAPTTTPTETPPADGGVDLNFLNAQSGAKKEAPTEKPSLDILVAPPAGGLPNATSIVIRKLVPRATKEMEDSLIKMNIRHASELLFPDQPLHVTAVILLLKKSSDTEPAITRLQTLIDKENLDLEYRRWHEIRPFFLRMTKMIGLIFDFVFIMLIVMVAFLIYNTQSSGIMERLGELGTLRAMGVTRIGLWRMLMLEGFMLGLIGGLLGLLIASFGDEVVQMLNIVYIPPSVTFYTKLEVLVLRDPIVLVQAFLGALVCSVFSSAWPAWKASRMQIVEALRHS